jgi:hypothetical protein
MRSENRMDTHELLAHIADARATFEDRLEAIDALGQVRLREVKLREARGEPRHLAGLSGTLELRAVMGQVREPLELRCQAAAVLAKTDVGAALQVCVELL